MAEPADQLSLIGNAAGAPERRSPRAKRGLQNDRVMPATTRLQRPPVLEPYRRQLFLGTSSWAFPGWQDLVYGEHYAEPALSRHGLSAYAQHPLLNGIGIDRGFYAALNAEEFAVYAGQVGDDFRFLVKAPDLVTSATRRKAGGDTELNAAHLDPTLACDRFIVPCLQGLGTKAAVLVFQFSPLPRHWLREPKDWIDRLGAFLAALPPLSDGAAFPRYAVELRDPPLLTPRLMKVLAAHRVLYCLSLHARMPPIERQLRALDASEQGHIGPLLARWNLHPGVTYEQARQRYAPFTRLIDEDPITRALLADRAAAVLGAGQPVMVIASNKAEGSAPLTLDALARAIAARLERDWSVPRERSERAWRPISGAAAP